MKSESPVFVVTPELQAVLDSVPPEAPRSRLEPFRTFILRWRSQGRSYRRIQQILADECHARVSYETLRRFVKRRSRPRRPKEVETAEQVEPSVPPPKPTAGNDRWAEARARMAEHKAQPVAPKPAKLFEYTEEDASRPIVFKKEK